MSAAFGRWAKGKLSSYPIEGAIRWDSDSDGQPMVSQILDAAGQKGTGRWTSESALELGIPLTLVTEAVFARLLSLFKEERVAAAEAIPGPDFEFSGDKNQLVDDLKRFIFRRSFPTPGFHALPRGSKEFSWNFDYQTIANIRRNGCIIRSALLTTSATLMNATAVAEPAARPLFPAAHP